MEPLWKKTSVAIRVAVKAGRNRCSSPAVLRTSRTELSVGGNKWMLVKKKGRLVEIQMCLIIFTGCQLSSDAAWDLQETQSFQPQVTLQMQLMLFCACAGKLWLAPPDTALLVFPERLLMHLVLLATLDPVIQVAKPTPCC